MWAVTFSQSKECR